MTRTLAFLSGIPALVYQVVWTREVGLLAGSQIEAISVVLVVFFGGLALGARILGGVVDRAHSALFCYGAFEVVAGVLAAATLPLLRWLGRTAQPEDPAVLLLYAGALLLPVTFLLGGTLPALLRESVRELTTAAQHAGAVNGANTAGSVLGVIIAVALIPTQGLLFTAVGAGTVSIGIGIVALRLSRGRARPRLVPAPRPAGDSRWPILVAAAIAGVATLAYEVLAARMATLQLGSSLYAWGAVLGLTLVGLAIGNLATSKRAARTTQPRLDLGHIEIGAAVALAVGLALFAPSPTVPSGGLTPTALLAVAAGVLPAAIAMGGAFPFFVRLAGQRPELGASFGAVSAANTAGGIAGALLAPFALLPGLGPVDGALFCAGINAALGLGFVASSTFGRRRIRVLAMDLALVLAACALGRATPDEVSTSPRLIFVDHGAQATVAVLQYGDRRDLVVDGDPEASTVSAARRTEEFLAVLPLLLHPDPKSILEVGLGSGITLGTAALFPLEHIECVEIAAGVLDAARFFAPENGAVSRGGDARLKIVHGDGRAHLLRRPHAFDVIIANTVHPWSVGATGLYSSEFFERLAGALRNSGIAVQWLPLGALGGDNLAAILRGFFGTFAHGSLWWGEDNAVIVGSDTPLSDISDARWNALAPSLHAVLKRLSIGTADELRGRRVADAGAVRAAIGAGVTLSDDRPVLERRTAGAQRAASISEYALLETIAREGVASRSAALRTAAPDTPLLLWIEVQAARARGEEQLALRLEAAAEAAGSSLARRARVGRMVAEAGAHRAEGRLDEAKRAYRAAFEAGSDPAEALLGLGLVAFDRGLPEEATTALERAVIADPGIGEVWNLLGVVRQQGGDAREAQRAFLRALDVSPFLPQALANAGLMAAQVGDESGARRMLRRLQAITPNGVAAMKEERTLQRELETRF